MIYKKILIVFLLFFTIFSFSTVFGAEISTTNVSSDLSYYVKEDKKMLLDAFHKNNIFSYDDFTNYVKNLGLRYSSFAWFYCIFPLGYNVSNNSPTISSDFAYVRNIYFFNDSNLPIMDSGSGTWYNVPTDYKLVHCSGSLSVRVNTGSLTFSTSKLPSQVPVPSCWQWFSISSLFADDIASSSINNVNETLTEDNSSQTDINLTTHNNEMNTASDSIKNSNLYNKFSNLSNNLQEAFTYNNDDVSTLPVSFNKKNVVLKSNEISKFFKNNNLSFVITLWQSILWFSLLYTMFLFIRKIYKSVVGGNPVDDVQKTLSNEDNKIVGGF